MADGNKKDDENIESFGYKQELKRVLTFKDLIFYGLMFIGPIAPMAIYGFVDQLSNGMVPMAYLVGAIAMAFTALSYSSMSKAFPLSGSVYTYASRGINKYVGFFAGWIITLDYFLTPAIAYLITGIAMQSIVPSIPYWIWILLFAVVNTLVNVLGIGMTAKVDIIFLLFSLFTLAAFCIAAALAVLRGVGAGAFTMAPFWSPEGFNINMIMTATSLAAFSFLGFDAISTLAEESNNPRKMVGRATITALILVAVLFMLQTYLAGLIMPNYKDITNPGTAFYTIAGIAGGPWLRYLTALAIAIIGAMGSGLTGQAASARLLYSMSRDGVMPSFFGKIHSKYKTPYVGTLAVGVAAILIGIFVPEDLLASMVNFGALTGFAFVNLAVISYYMFVEKSHNIGSILRYFILPLIGFLVIGYVWVSLQTLAMIVGISWSILGFIYLLSVTRGFTKTLAFGAGQQKMIKSKR